MEEGVEKPRVTAAGVPAPLGKIKHLAV